MKATFENSVSVLVRAYMNDTLVHNNCYACAVGNLVAAANGYTYTKCVDYPSRKLALAENNGVYKTPLSKPLSGGAWYNAIDWMHPEPNNEFSLKEIDSIGYSVEQVVAIEQAFESAEYGDDRMFNGLIAVVEVLAEIHGVDLSVKEQAVAQFQTIHAGK